jgi:hypothetical protein
MKELIIQFEGDDWVDEKEAEHVEEAVQDALDYSGIKYVDIHVK